MTARQAPNPGEDALLDGAARRRHRGPRDGVGSLAPGRARARAAAALRSGGRRGRRSGRVHGAPAGGREIPGRRRSGDVLLGIAVERRRHHRRAALRRRKALERLRAVDRLGPVNPEQDACRRQLGARLAAALDEMPLPQRVAFVLCEVEELTSVQAAVMADAPEAIIRTRLFHARRRLRDLLAGERTRCGGNRSLSPPPFAPSRK